MPRKKKLNQRQLDSVDWYKDVLKRFVNKKASLEYDKKYRRIKEGELLLMAYPNPKTPLKQLKFFDAQPLAMLFNTKSKNIFAVNLHYMSTPQREIFLKYVIKLNKNNIRTGKRFTLSWEMINEYLHKNGLAHIAVKQYIKPRIRNIEYIPYSQWKYAIHLPSERFVFDGEYSHDDITSMVRRAGKKTKSSKNTVSRKKR